MNNFENCAYTLGLLNKSLKAEGISVRSASNHVKLTLENVNKCLLKCQ